MSDKIYKLLNNTKQNIHEWESKPLDDSEVDEIMRKFKNEKTVYDTPNKKIHRKNIIVVVAAVVALLGCTTAVAATGLNVFERQRHANDMTFTHTVSDSTETMELPLDKYANKYNYEDIAKTAKEVEEIKIAETDNFKMQTESIYCDGTTLMIGISGSMKDGNPLHKKLINLNNLKVTIGNSTFDALFGEGYPGFGFVDGELVLDEGENNRFSGNIRIILLGDKAITKPESVEVTIRNITAQENYMDENYIELGNNLKLSVNAAPDESLKNKNAYTITDGDYSVRFYEISPAMMIVGFKSNDSDIHAWLHNEDGEYLENISLWELPDYNDGFSIGCMIPVTSGCVKAWFKGDDKSTVAKEIIINMEDVITHLKNNN